MNATGGHGNDKYLIFFDLETGGINPARHPIIQIAAIAVNSVLEPVEAFEAKVQFSDAQATKQSLRKNHYSRGLWARDGLPPGEVADRFSEFLKRYASHPATTSSGSAYSVAQLVAHNSAFDGPFLQAWFARHDRFLPARFQVLCTLQRAQWLFAENPNCRPPANFKLATLCEYFRVPFHAANAHEALGDVTATFMLYKAIVAAEQTLHAGDVRMTQQRQMS